MKFLAINQRVIIRPNEEKETESGILLSTSQERVLRGIVEHAMEGELKIGDEVAFLREDALKLTKDLVLLKSEDILAKIYHE